MLKLGSSREFIEISHTSFVLQPAEIEALLLKTGENGQAAKDAAVEDKPTVAAGPKFGWIIGVFVRAHSRLQRHFT